MKPRYTDGALTAITLPLDGRLGAGAMTLVIHHNGCPELAAIRAELDDASPAPMRPMEVDEGEEL